MMKQKLNSSNAVDGELRQPHLNKTSVSGSTVYVTLDWAFKPITTKGDGYILPRNIEMIINAKYYPTGTVGEWPCDPITGERLPVEPDYCPTPKKTICCLNKLKWYKKLKGFFS